MTNSEAIHILKQYLDMDSEVKSEYLEAQRMAIKALEQQPCETIEEIPKDYKYDTETEDFLVYRHKYTGHEIHIEKPVPRYKLEQQPCEDAISREATKEMLTEEWTKYMPMELDMNLSFVLEKISELPSVTPKARWIPCSERLPEDYIHVLCQFTLGGMGECYLAHGVFHLVGGLIMTCNEVMAWQPLPQPYKAENKTKQGLAYADQDTMMPAT